VGSVTCAAIVGARGLWWLSRRGGGKWACRSGEVVLDQAKDVSEKNMSKFFYHLSPLGCSSPPAHRR
jgi:hypothetical protein